VATLRHHRATGIAFIAVDGSAQVVPGMLSEQDLDGRLKTVAKA
jgi:hypothetical protein